MISTMKNWVIWTRWASCPKHECYKYIDDPNLKEHHFAATSTPKKQKIGKRKKTQNEFNWFSYYNFQKANSG